MSSTEIRYDERIEIAVLLFIAIENIILMRSQLLNMV